jgi:CHASE2 domain-containing sensor protein
MRNLSLLAIALFVFSCSMPLASAQTVHLPPTITQPQGTGSPPVANDDDVQRQQATAANQQRQIELRRDTDKLAELTQELKEYLAKTDQGVMSVDAIKKAEQIEKLAHSVKSKMKQSF